MFTFTRDTLRFLTISCDFTYDLFTISEIASNFLTIKKFFWSSAISEVANDRKRFFSLSVDIKILKINFFLLFLIFKKGSLTAAPCTTLNNNLILIITIYKYKYIIIITLLLRSNNMGTECYDI